MQVPSCIVGQFNTGAGLTWGSDKVLLVRDTDACRDGPRDTDVGGATVGKQVSADGLVYWESTDLPFGGVWRMCYCANYDSPLDNDNLPCSSVQDFPADAGRLSVTGAYPGQNIFCTRNEVCTFTLQGEAMNKDIHKVAVRDSSTTCGSTTPMEAATRRRRDLTGNPYAAVRRVSASAIEFTVNPVEVLDAFTLCLCVPPPGGNPCAADSLVDYDQTVGALDIRGATAQQTFVCGRGGLCKLTVEGRGLARTDVVKVVNMSTNCDGDAHTEGFFRSIQPAEADSTTVQAFFDLGRVTAQGTYKVCYCASLKGCGSMASYNHVAGLLVVLDPLSNLLIEGADASTISIKVTSRINSENSRIACAAAVYEPPSMPDAALIQAGLGQFGVGKGVSKHPTVNGTNIVAIFLEAFVDPGQQYRIWCVEESAQSFVLPSHLGGAVVITPTEIKIPRLRVYPSFLWPGARFFAETFGVGTTAVDLSLGIDQPRTDVRVINDVNSLTCNRAKYESAEKMRVTDAGQFGDGSAAFMSEKALTASPFRPYVCFFIGPNASGIAMEDDRLIVQTEPPQFVQQRLDGQVTKKFYRGVLMQISMKYAAQNNGLIHWMVAPSDCTGASRVGPAAQLVTNSNTSYFRFTDPVGTYTLCYLGRQSESTTVAPFNPVGDPFEVTEAITGVQQDGELPSTRNTVRIEIEVRVPGRVKCLTRSGPADTRPADFSGGLVFEGLAHVDVGPPPPGTDPEYPRMFKLAIPLVHYQETAGPMHVWCQHSLAEELVFPANNLGISIPLQREEPSVMTSPSFLWTSANFKLSLMNTPDLTSKLVAMHEPTLPAGWRREIAISANDTQVLRYFGPNNEVLERHPVYESFLKDSGPGPCEGRNSSNAQGLTEADNTKIKSWFTAEATRPFVCYWASESSFPHLVGVLKIAAQPPEYALEIGGQFRPFVYRGVGIRIRVSHASPTGGRVLVVSKTDFDAFGGSCQQEPKQRLLQMDPLQLPVAPTRLLQPRPQVGHNASRVLQAQDCTSSQRRTSELKIIPPETLFPKVPYGQEADAGMNCTKDYSLYYNEMLANTSILADKVRNRYFLVTSNISVLLFFIPRINMLTPDGNRPNTSTAVVLSSFDSLANVSEQSWLVRTTDCVVQLLVAPASPMYEEGAEDLPLQQYLESALEISDFGFFAGIVYLTDSPGSAPAPLGSLYQKSFVCRAVQPPAPPPARPESPLDIDKPEFGRSVVDGAVDVPSMFEGVGSFLHVNPLGQYVMCYVGDSSDEPRVFNQIGDLFETRDVLPVERFMVPLSPMSNSERAYLNVTSMIRGVVRCLALLRNAEPPTDPAQIFQPDTTNKDYVASSEPVQFDVPETHALLPFEIDQVQAEFITRADSFAQAKPTIYVWCAHEGSTVLYPNDATGFKLEIQARPPPPFVYRQFNRTVSIINLTLDLEFDPIVREYANPVFPANQYDIVKFSTRPMLPSGLSIDQATGAITGRPEVPGIYERTIVATSRNPPMMTSSVDIVIDIADVMSLERRSVNVDHVVFTTRPRSTNLFVASQIFILIQPKNERFQMVPTEFFCIAEKVPKVGEGIQCKAEQEKCCCLSSIAEGVTVADFRISTRECGLQELKKYHAAGLVKGTLTTKDGERVSGLRSSRKVDISMPKELDVEMKKPVVFDIVLKFPLEEWQADEDSIRQQLVEELHQAVAIPRELVEIVEARSFAIPSAPEASAAGDGATAAPTPAPTAPAGDAVPASNASNSSGGARRLGEYTVVDVSFGVEPRCLETRTAEVEMFSIVDIKEGCNLVAPEEYMRELGSQLSDETSAIFFRDDLPLLKKASAKYSFSQRRMMFFCSSEPFGLHGAIVKTEDECPYDLIKFPIIAGIAATCLLLLMFATLCYLSAECANLSFLYKIRCLDIFTPVMAIYTTAADYLWLVMLKGAASESPTGGTMDFIFLVVLCHLLVCFCVNAVALRITITSYILDTPWWRRNRRRLTLVLFFSTLAPRFFRITRSNLFGFDITHIHFGTPSKMSVVFSNLGMISCIQDIPQLLIHFYVWLVWRNQGPRISLICLVLSSQSIITSILHHVFSRSQRAAYERVVKLLGVRRLTAGFFDVSSAVGQQAGGGGIAGLLESMRKSGDTAIDYKEDETGGDSQMNAIVDPRKLDPIQAAMYVSQMYEKEARGAKDDDDDDHDHEGGAGGHAKGKQVYPKPLYDKMKKFYAEHDPTLLDTIEMGEAKVDEGRLDAELKRRFGVGLDSV
eukprot:TRINITY_DN6697_c0_g1_i2.p1 TRINITY_DN6697_c0_g1~~TRINITY_DN6697_c0_g1_i2.p1  ORF type:complete len:2550 (+),score=402.01 TRINITY_DN6697_c0_g1_i2:927-7652(+)